MLILLTQCDTIDTFAIMPRRARSIEGGYVYHLFNRANGGATLFKKPGDFELFETVLVQAVVRFNVRLLGYVVMPDHWQLVVWPEEGAAVSDFVRWLTVTHARRWRSGQGTVGAGHVYQGRFKAFPIQPDGHVATVLRYVEGGARWARFVKRADEWRWSSLWRRMHRGRQEEGMLHDGPIALPRRWADLVNEPLNNNELEAIEICAQRGRPFGDDEWRQQAVEHLGLGHTMRGPGRPTKAQVPKAAVSQTTPSQFEVLALPDVLL